MINDWIRVSGIVRSKEGISPFEFLNDFSRFLDEDGWEFIMDEHDGKPAYYTVEEVAGHLGVGIETLLKLIKKNKFKALFPSNLFNFMDREKADRDHAAVFGGVVEEMIIEDLDEYVRCDPPKPNHTPEQMQEAFNIAERVDDTFVFLREYLHQRIEELRTQAIDEQGTSSGQAAQERLEELHLLLLKLNDDPDVGLPKGCIDYLLNDVWDPEDHTQIKPIKKFKEMTPEERSSTEKKRKEDK